MNDLVTSLLILITYLGAGTLTAGIALRLGQTETDSWFYGLLWPFCLLFVLCRYPFRFLAHIARLIGITPAPHPKEIPMSNPEIKFTLVARYETQPREGGYASCETPQACLDIDREMLEEGHIGLDEFINFIGEFAEVEWTFELVDSPTGTPHDS